MVVQILIKYCFQFYHGGGFAGTIQAFVPVDKTAEYVRRMDALFGDGSCYVLRIRPVGGIQVV